MQEGIQAVLVYIIGAGIVGLVVAVGKLWTEFNAHKLHVAEMYMNKNAADEIKSEIKDLRYIVWRIADKLEVPAVVERY